MTKLNYTVGDYVQRKEVNRFGVFRYNHGPFRVTEITSAGDVRFETNPNPSKVSQRWTGRFFEKVPAPVTGDTFILVLKKGSTYLPATEPKTYTSEAQAKAVAAEMAEKHPGKEFVIFKAVGRAKTIKTTVEMF